MRIVAIVTTYNESRYVRACLEHYRKNGVEVYILDNESTDGTRDIVKEYLNENVIALEVVPRRGYKDWKSMLCHKESIADRIKADWFMHADIDEIRLSFDSKYSLAQAVELVDKEGYNAINFMEYTFIPTLESPDHDHGDFMHTMQWYYPFLQRYPHRVNLWKKQARHWPGIKAKLKDLYSNRRLLTPSVNLHSSGGHQVKFEGLRMFPTDFKMRHYPLVSREHAIQKYVQIRNSPNAPSGYHGWRGNIAEGNIVLPSQSQLRKYLGDDALDPANPLAEHLIIKK
jgi:glycosyltransferase involved in cell wall biosynthesis